jgi:hypothetical protein
MVNTVSGAMVMLGLGVSVVSSDTAEVNLGQPRPVCVAGGVSVAFALYFGIGMQPRRRMRVGLFVRSKQHPHGAGPCIFFIGLDCVRHHLAWWQTLRPCRFLACLGRWLALNLAVFAVAYPVVARIERAAIERRFAGS